MAQLSHHIENAPVDDRRLLRYLNLVVMVGAWILVGAALISHDPADWPGRFIAPHNVQPSNWVGQVGAWVASEFYLMLGPGVWILLAGWMVLLVAMFRNRKVKQLVLRTIGLLLMCLSTSSLLGLFMSSTTNHPFGAGGMLADFVNYKLLALFGHLGTLMILLVVFWVGAVVAMDEMVEIVGKMVLRCAHMTTNVTWPKMMAGKFSRRPTHGGVADDLKSRPMGSNERPHEPDLDNALDEDDRIDPDAGGLGAIESFDQSDSTIQLPLMDQDSSKPTEVDTLEPDSPESSDDASGFERADEKKVGAEELRAKIKKLPINISSSRTGKTPPPREMDLSGYRFPDVSLLEDSETSFTTEMELVVRDQAVELESALQQYRIEGEVVGIDSGPAITMFEARLAPGTKVAQIQNISSDIARVLKVQNIRVVPNMAGKDTVGIEVPNLKKEKVRLKDLMTSNGDTSKNMKLPMWLGKDASGNPLVADLAAMPHMLIAGTTGSGKSVCINAIIVSFLYVKRPDELKLILIDPKMVEMSMFREIPHLMCPVVTEVSRATAILEWATTKMDERYELLAEAGVRDIGGYNNLTWEELTERMGPEVKANEARIPKRLPYLVFIVDELADLMMTAKEVEGYIVRLAQKSRAVGMHLILATQRPQANVVTGLIKSNMPCRVSFKVASGMDSRIVLDQKGAELLMGQGDMLYLSPRTSKITRSQGTLVEDSEIRRVVGFLNQVAAPNFEPQLMQMKTTDLDEEALSDPLFDKAVRIVLDTNRGSVSLLQRRLTIGYSRASRLIEQMASAGIIGDYKGSQAREVQITLDEWEALKSQAEADADADQAEEVAQKIDTEPDQGEELEDFEDKKYEEDESNEEENTESPQMTDSNDEDVFDEVEQEDEEEKDDEEEEE